MNATKIREHPILFKDAMIRALLSGEKTQTRRVVTAPIDFVGPGGPFGANKDDPTCWGWEDDDGDWWKLEPDGRWEHRITCPHGRPGDRLWVREAWRSFHRDRDGRCTVEKPDRPCQHVIDYKATPACAGVPIRWRPSIHMPRYFCRLALEITEVRVQRIQSISDDDARAEGVVEYVRGKGFDPDRVHPRAAWADLWDHINAGRESGRYAWDRNPWAWAITFRRVEDFHPEELESKGDAS